MTWSSVYPAVRRLVADLGIDVESSAYGDTGNERPFVESALHELAHALTADVGVPMTGDRILAGIRIACGSRICRDDGAEDETAWRRWDFIEMETLAVEFTVLRRLGVRFSSAFIANYASGANSAVKDPVRIERVAFRLMRRRSIRRHADHVMELLRERGLECGP